MRCLRVGGGLEYDTVRFTRVTVGYLEGIGEPVGNTKWMLIITMPDKFRSLQAGPRGFDGPVSMLSYRSYRGRKSTYNAVSESADNKTFLATVAIVVDGNDVTRLTEDGPLGPQQMTKKRPRTVISPVTGADLYSSILS